MIAAAFALFDTEIGRCAIAWRGEAVCGFAIPAASDAETADSLRRRIGGAEPAEPPAVIGEAIRAVRRLLAGESTDLSFIPVDLAATPDFERRVYAALRGVAPGATITYGELAERAGSPGAARAVGMAMARNPVPVIIPCHRVLAGARRSGGFSAPGGVATKFKLLQIEQAGRGEAGMLFEDLPLAVKG